MKTSHEGNYGEIITRRKTSYHHRPAWPSSPWSWSPRTWPGRGSFGWCSTWAGLALPFFLELNFLNWTGFLVSFIVSKINLNLILRWDNLAKNVQVSPPQPGLERQQAATPKCHWKFSFIGLIVRTSIVDLRAGPGQIYGNWNVSPPALLHYNTEYLDSFT